MQGPLLGSLACERVLDGLLERHSPDPLPGPLEKLTSVDNMYFLLEVPAVFGQVPGFGNGEEELRGALRELSESLEELKREPDFRRSWSGSWSGVRRPGARRVEGGWLLLTVDASTLVGELLRRRGQALLSCPEIELYVPSRMWDRHLDRADLDSQLKRRGASPFS